MPWRFFGHAKADPSAPRAAGICDRCNQTYQLNDLKFQHQWRGTALQNTYFRVCPRCLDVPSAFLKALLLPADPVPVPYPRVDQFQAQMNNSSPALNWDQANARWDDSISTWDP